jgi:hypothetical protein
MPSDAKICFLQELGSRFGKLEKFGESNSLYQISGSNIQIYIRYSKTHSNGRAFYGIREKDLQQIEGYPSILCFLWDGQKEPLLIPFSEYDDVFRSTTPAEDGQYKVLISPREETTELYISKAGRFNVDGYFGWEQIEKLVSLSNGKKVPDLSHSQIQTLLGAIGVSKEFDVWIPPIDRTRLDWNIARQFTPKDNLPNGFEQVVHILREVDVVWIKRGSNTVKALFEVEHSTPIYSGLLRFNDIHLVAPELKARFSIVANSERRSLFARQINRPTFKASGLEDLCTFFEYTDVHNWHERISGR